MAGPISSPGVPSPPMLITLTFDGWPDPTIIMNGIRVVVEPCVRTTAPEYSPAGGAAPESVTVSVLEAPAARLMLEELSASVAFGSVPFEPLTVQQETEVASVA